VYVTTTKAEMREKIKAYVLANYRNFLQTALSFEDSILIQKLDSDIPARNAMIKEAFELIQDAIMELDPEPVPEPETVPVKIVQVIHSLPSNYKIDDDALFDWLDDYEFDITQIAIHNIEEKSIEYWKSFEVILLPYGYSVPSIANLLASDVPIISVEEGFADELELGTGGSTFKKSTREFYITDNTHPITLGLPLGEWDWSGSGFMWTQATDRNGYTDATVLVDTGVVGQDILIVHNIKKYVFFGWYRASQWDDEGWDMMQRAIEWAIDRSFP